MGEYDLGATHFESERLQALGKALDDARYRRLGQGWRFAVTAKERVPGTSTLFTDGDRLAVEFLHMMPAAEWGTGGALPTRL